MAKVKPTADFQLERQDVDLFKLLAAIDKKDYAYYRNLTPEQQKKVAMYILVQWTSSISKGSMQEYYLRSVEYHANKYFLNETVSKHPELQWLMLCAASPGMGTYRHHWIPSLSHKMSLLQSPAVKDDIVKYYTKTYPNASSNDINELSTEFVTIHKKKMYLAKLNPQLKIEDIEILVNLVSDSEIRQYEKDSGR